MLGGCVSLPTENDLSRRNDALGTITVSSLHFVPLEKSASGDKALNFGYLRSESNLWNLVERPSLGISDLLYHRTELDIAAKLAGSMISQASQQTAQSAGNVITNFSSSTNGRSFKTPEVPNLSSLSDVGDAAARDKLLKLLERSPSAFHLPPDQIASLVAAYKTYMVNLEEYLNMEGVDFDQDGGEFAFYPYKAYFTVSATPGWYSRYQQHDAVAEITFAGDASGPLEMRVVAAMPAETAQAIDEFAAAFRALTLSLTAEGQYAFFAGKGKFEDVLEKARRLEGLRTEKLITVAFPGQNKLSVRFRPAQNSSKEERMLDSLAKPMMALVMIRSAGRRPKTNEIEHVNSIISAAKRRAPAFSNIDTETNRTLVLGTPQLEVLPGRTDKVSEPKLLISQDTQIINAGYFAPAGKFSDGNWKAPKNYVPWFGDSTKRLLGERITNSANVPPWLGDFRKPLRIFEVGGIYHVDLSRVTGLQFLLDRADSEFAQSEKRLADLESKLKTLDGDLSKAQEKMDKAQKAITSLEDQRKKAKDNERKELQDQLSTKQNELKDVQQEVARSQTAIKDGKNAKGQLELALKSTAENRAKYALSVSEELTKALSCASATLRIRVDSPKHVLNEARTAGLEAEILLTGHIHLTNFTVRVPTGPGEHVLTLPCINLTGICPWTNCATLPELNINVAAQLREKATTNNVHAATATNATISPGFHAPVAGKPEAAKSSPGATNTTSVGSVLQINLEQARITLDGKTATAPTK